jgi:hypothetical protein
MAHVGERERDLVARELGEHFAQGHLTLEEYEFRVQAALQARQGFELSATVNDLPSLDRVSARVRTSTDGGRRTGRTVFALMGGASRMGRWTVPTTIRAVGVMGGVVIDLRDAVFSHEVTAIHALALMGGVEIIVPPGVRIESDGIAIMGGFEDQPGLPAVFDDEAPVLRVRGLALMGAVTIRMKPRGVPDDDSDD